MHFTTTRTKRVIFAPILITARWLGRNFPETLVRIRYFLRFHRFLNLRNPQTLNEKIQYLSFRTDTSLWTSLSDKHEVRKYIEECGLGDILIPQIALYNTAEEIDLNTLPNEFVIKTTHGSGDVMIVKDKSSVNENEMKSFFHEMLKHRYGELEGGQHYMRIKPRVVAEKLLRNDEKSKRYSTSMIDYKFWCFNGKPYACFVCTNRTKKTIEFALYDNNWEPIPNSLIYSKEHLAVKKNLPKPENFERMLEVAEILSRKFPCVRVDLYNLDGKIYFGEMTFTSLGGLMNYFTPAWLTQAGNCIDVYYKCN